MPTNKLAKYGLSDDFSDSSVTWPALNPGIPQFGGIRGTSSRYQMFLFRGKSQDSQQASRQVEENYALQSYLCQATTRRDLGEGYSSFQLPRGGKFVVSIPEPRDKSQSSHTDGI
jgi:hypothetical protein